MSLSILLVDDHPVFLFGLRMLIQGEADLRIAGEAMNAADALRLLASQPVDLVVVDINLPDMNGVELTRRIRQAHPETRILILTMLDDNTVFNALRAGANGYILKGAGGDETLRAIRAISKGEAIFSPTIARRILGHFNPAQVGEPFPELTVREREILDLVAQGLTNTAIAGRLSLSVKTVRNRVSDIFAKLHVSDRPEAIIKAREAGMGRD